MQKERKSHERICINGALLSSLISESGLASVKLASLVGRGSELTRDERDLMRLGKKPVLKRNFGFMSVLGFSCTVLITWEGMLIVSTQSLVNGGPAGVIWGYLIVWIGTISVFAILSELASMQGTNRWQAVTASAAYLIGTLLQSVIILAKPDYSPQPWQAMLFLWAILAFAVFINTVASKTLAKFEGLILILHILGFLGILIPLVYLAPHGDASIFTTFVNEGGWPTQGLSFMVGLPSAVFSLIGADSAVHMAEEIKNASTVVPRAILITIILNGVLGFAMLLAYLFCLGDLDAVLESQNTLGYPFLFVFQAGTQSIPGAVVMGLVVVALGICSTVGVLASSSRMLWSFSRDRGIPLWKHFIKLDQRTSIPIYTIGFTTTVSVLLSLIILGSSVAFSNIVNLSVVGLYSSYLLSCSLLLWRRLQGIEAHDSDATLVGYGNIQWGPWRIPRVLGVINNVFACVYLFVLWFWAFWPPATPVVAANMNFSVLTFGFTTLFAIFWYFIRGKHEYRGPVVEVEFS
ncbi:putative GABA permease [Daldinia loculata]|uniref:putative GABA permease n=1 Tax=Daldinia loculata TaxID=103429 RepID=UPI0020C2E1A9|nr:putative GABA permease [Daldinia loculata]KAI1646302.1 putative GABA permease [Daldinia loculata]